MENALNEMLLEPGQLWKNMRTGDVLFIYRRNRQIEGVLGDGRRWSDLDVIKIVHNRNSWKCIYRVRTEIAESGEDELRAS